MNIKYKIESTKIKYLSLLRDKFNFKVSASNIRQDQSRFLTMLVF